MKSLSENPTSFEKILSHYLRTFDLDIHNLSSVRRRGYNLSHFFKEQKIWFCGLSVAESGTNWSRDMEKIIADAQKNLFLTFVIPCDLWEIQGDKLLDLKENKNSFKDLMDNFEKLIEEKDEAERVYLPRIDQWIKLT